MSTNCYGDSFTAVNQSNRQRFCFTDWRIGRILPSIVLVAITFLVWIFNHNSRQVAISDWGQNISRNITDYVPFERTTLLEPRNICREKVFIVIVVTSRVQGFQKRQAIRETWGNTLEFNYGMFSQLNTHLKGQYLEPTEDRIEYYREFLNLTDKQTTIPAILPLRIVFLIGRSKYESLLGQETMARLHSESEQYDDIIQENFVDTYNNLTLKSVFALKWVTRRCLQQSAFFMKCDDDTFVNIPNLLHFLLGGTVPRCSDTVEFYDVQTYNALAPNNRLNSTSEYLTGHLFCALHPNGKVTNKWYMPYYMYPDSKYPKYLSGSGYLMSMDVVPRLYEAAINTTFIYLEDVYVTGLCADKAFIQRRFHPLFRHWYTKTMSLFKGIIVQHVMDHMPLKDVYRFVINTTNRCQPPAKTLNEKRLPQNKICE